MSELRSKCCRARVKYSNNYILGALMGYEDYKCPKCGHDPCEVEKIGASKMNKDDIRKLT